MYAPCWRGCYPAVVGASKSVIILLIQHHSSVICPILTFSQRTAEHSYHSSRACMVDCALTAPPPLPGPRARLLVPGKQVVTTMHCFDVVWSDIACLVGAGAAAWLCLLPAAWLVLAACCLVGAGAAGSWSKCLVESDSAYRA